MTEITRKKRGGSSRAGDRNLRNVTVTLDEETARWARIQAAKDDLSVSRLIGAMLREKMEEDVAYEAARARYFSQTPGIHRQPGQKLPSRDELHERQHLR